MGTFVRYAVCCVLCCDIDENGHLFRTLLLLAHIAAIVHGQPDPLIFKNWGETVIVEFQEFHQPESEEEIIEIVLNAAAAGELVSVTGASHASSPIAATTGHLINLDKMNRLLRVDGTTVTFEAGIRGIDLTRELEAFGLAIPNHGTILDQSLAGYTQTNTHGTGLATAAMSSFITALRLIIANGTIVDVRPETHPILFASARMGIGVLGIVSEITLQTVPLFLITRTITTVELDDVVPLMGTLPDDFDRFQFDIFNDPANGEFELTTRLRTFEVVDDDTEIDGCWIDPDVGGSRADNCTDVVFRAISDGLSPPSAEVPQFLFDALIPVERGEEFMDEWLRLQVGELAPLLPFLTLDMSMRSALADDIWMSPFFERDCISLDFDVFFTDELAFKKYVAAFHKISLKFGARHHWGKTTWYTREIQRALNPRFDAFVALRQIMDPDGVFLDDYTRDLFGPV